MEGAPLVWLSRLVGKAREFVPRLSWSRDARAEGNAAGVAFANQIAALGVDATHAPEAFRCAGKPRGIQSDGIGMILVHVLDDARFGGDEVSCPIGGNE